MSEHQLKEPTQQEISDCAYFHWQDGGSLDGREDQYWFAAETELMQQWMAGQGIVWTRETEQLPSTP